MLCLPGLLQQEPLAPLEPLAPCRPVLTHSFTEDTQKLKGRSGSVSCGVLGPGMHKVLFEPSKHLWQVWDLILNVILPLLPSCWGFSFALGHRISFMVGSNIFLSMIVQLLLLLSHFSHVQLSATS